MKDFSYHRPSSVSEAIALLAASGESRPLSGGMTLLPTMKQRLASPSALIDLTALSELSGITIGDGNVTIGAMTTHAEVA
jgi:carbon-monoxide dehydrogenase medium subunit